MKTITVMSGVYFYRHVRLWTNRKTRNKMMQNFHHISAFLVYSTFTAKLNQLRGVFPHYLMPRIIQSDPQKQRNRRKAGATLILEVQ